MPAKEIPIRDMHTGERWSRMIDAADAIGVTPGAISVALRDHRPVQGHWLVVDGDEPIVCPCCKDLKAIPKEPRTPAVMAAREEAARAVG